MSLRFCSLGSGSAGNATVIEASQGITTTRLLVDCGFSERELKRRLARVGLDAEDLDGVFVTHEHGDHVGCALALAQRHRLPLWTSRGTWRALQSQPRFSDRLDPALLQLCGDGAQLSIGDLLIRPFAVPHDAQEPLQLSASDGALKLGVLTDIGSSAPRVLEALQACDALLLECNHDEDMLRKGRYPPALKRRILGSHGHLSNEAAAAILADCLHEGLRLVAAAHLSEHNNRPELARAALAGIRGADQLELQIADQAQGLDWQRL